MTHGQSYIKNRAPAWALAEGNDRAMDALVYRGFPGDAVRNAVDACCSGLQMHLAIPWQSLARGGILVMPVGTYRCTTNDDASMLEQFGRNLPLRR